MTNIVQNKYRVSRRILASVWGSPKDAFNKRNYKPGQHGLKSRRTESSLFSKKANDQEGLKYYFKHYYALSRKKIENYSKLSQKMKGNTRDNFVALLESRLSSVVYHACFAPSIFSAKQLVSHKHVTVNDKVINISSYLVKAGDVIKLKDRVKNIPLVLQAVSSGHRRAPDYIEINLDSRVAVFIRVPMFSEIPYPAIIYE